MKLNKLSNNFYYTDYDTNSDRATLGYYCLNNKAILLDSGNSKKHIDEVLTLLKDNNLPYPTYCCLTHSHWDHSFGLSYLDCISIGCKNTYDKLKDMTTWQWTLDAMVQRLDNNKESLFSHNNILKEYTNLNDIQVKNVDIVFNDYLYLDQFNTYLYHVDSPHEIDCVVIYIPDENILFLGDAYCSVPVGNDWIYDKDKLKTFINYLQQYNHNTICIKGHHDIQPVNELIDELNSYL